MRKSTTFARLFREQGSRKAVKLMSRRQWKYPAALEHQYARSIKFYLDKSWKGYAQTLIDSYVPARMDALEDIWPEDPTRGPVLGALVTIAENMEKFNQREWDAFKKIAVGAAFSEDNGWTQAVVDEWARTQVTLITKASNDMRDAVARRVRNGVAEGQNNDEIKALIMRDLPGISTRRAAIIARDQTAKLNADLSQERMEQAGIETYIWSTSMDERVRGLPGGKYADSRTSHYVMEGLICRWDDPTKYRNASGEWVPRPMGAPLLHPGQDIMCRCVALPNWGELDELTDATPEERAQTELEMAQEALQRAQTAASYVDPSNPAYKEFEKVSQEAQKFLESLKKSAPVLSKKVEKAAAASVVKRVLQTEHPARDWDKYPETKDFLKVLQPGWDEDRLATTSRAIQAWSGEDAYYHMRLMQSGADLSSYQSVNVANLKKHEEALESFIQDSPKWSGGPTYRGIDLDDEAFESLKDAVSSGQWLNMRGTSSWTTDPDIADHFIGEDHSVVFVCKGPNRGTSIMDLSEKPYESEVLVSKHARYQVQKVEMKRDVMFIEVEEVSDGW